MTSREYFDNVLRYKRIKEGEVVHKTELSVITSIGDSDEFHTYLVVFKNGRFITFRDCFGVSDDFWVPESEIEFLKELGIFGQSDYDQYISLREAEVKQKVEKQKIDIEKKEKTMLKNLIEKYPYDVETIIKSVNDLGRFHEKQSIDKD